MLTEFECVADTLGAFPFGFLSKELDMAEFTNVAHVCSSTRAHVNTVTDLDDTKFLDTRWEKVHVGSVGGHDGVDFISRHHGVRHFQGSINSLVGCCNEVRQHGFIK